MTALRICAFILVVGISGCATTSFLGFKKDDHSGAGRGEAKLNVLRVGTAQTDFGLPDPELQNVAARECRQSQQEIKVVGYLVPLIAAAGQLLFTLWTNEQLREIAAISKAAKPAPSTVRVAMVADTLREAECIAFVRMTESKDKNKPPIVGLSILLKIVKQPMAKPTDAYVMIPIYARAFNSIAVAGKPSAAGEFAKMEVAVAVSVKQVSRTEIGDPTIALQGEALMKVGELGIGPNAVARCVDDERARCDASDLIVLPPKGAIISLSLSVAEIGNVGFDVDAAEAELKAINAAIGPAIGTAIEARLK
jgi:hypothetical protein